MTLVTRNAIAAITVTLLLIAPVIAADSAAQAPEACWPQWRGPNRNGVAPASPRLLDNWPKEGPPLLWKSPWIPSCEEGGCGHPAVADGKVFVYSNAKIPLDGGDGYAFVADDLLHDAGWVDGLPDELAKKIEAAWVSPQRPACGWEWYNPAVAHQDGAVEACLAKKPELDIYISGFLQTLGPDDVKKYGPYIKRRLCIDTPKNKWGVCNGLSWDTLIKLSKLRDVRHHTRREWDAELDKVSHDAVSLCENFPGYFQWNRLFKMADVIYCLDVNTGKVLWRKEFAEDPAVTKNTKNVQWWVFDSIGSCSTPAIIESKVYVSGAMGLYCLSAADGAPLWQVKGEPVHSQVLVANGVVYDAARGAAYDAQSGAPLWINPLWPKDRWPVKDDQTRWSPPLLWKTQGKTCIITSDGGVSSYCCLDIKTGNLLWSLKTPMAMFADIWKDTLIAPSPYGGGGTKAFDMTLAGTQLAWKQGYASGDGDIVYQDHLYTINRCIDLKTGAVNWKSTIGIDAIAPLLLADGKIISQWGSSHQITKQWGGGYSLLMFKATPEGYVELGRFNPHACHMCSPAISDGKLFVRLLDSVACYDLADHGIYVDSITAGKDSVVFRFKQTGGGLFANTGSGLKNVQIKCDNGTTRAADASIDGDSIIVNIKDAIAPTSITTTANSFAGKNGLPVPAFSWNEPRELKLRKCFDNTFVLTTDLPLFATAGWEQPATYSIEGAHISRIQIDPNCKSVALTTDKTWKTGDAVAVTYSAFPVDQGEPRKQTLNFVVPQPQPAAATFIKVDDATSGNWKGVYGSEGALIAGDKNSAPPKYVIVAPTNKSDSSPWAASPADTRFLQRSADVKDRSIINWASPDQFEISLEFTDGKEHQLALYCLDWGKTEMTVEVLDADTDAVLNTQTLTNYNKGKYLVWNLKGQVKLRFFNVKQDEGSQAVAGGVFFDAVGKAGK